MATSWLFTDDVLNLLQSKVNSGLGGSPFSIANGAGGLALGLAGPGGTTLKLDGLQNDGGGLAGHLHIDGLGAASALKTELLPGFTIALTEFDLAVSNGSFSAASIAGKLTVPYFTEGGNPKAVDVEVALRHDGTPAVVLAAQQTGPDGMTPDGHARLRYNIGGGVTVELQIAALEVGRSASGVMQLVLGGALLISSPGLQWPEFQFTNLRIDSAGHVELDGGWIDLPGHTAIDFFGFHLALQKLGVGSDQTGRWIGFNGDLHLVEGIPLGGSVRGLRINLDTGQVAFAGVSVDFEIPGVLSFKGEIEHIHADTAADYAALNLPSTLPVPADVFAGSVQLLFEVVPGLEVDAKLIVGHFGGISVFFLALDAELPVGIPLFIDVSLYGLNGLFASNFRPDPAASGQTWWDWYKNPDAGGQGAFDATDVQKWLPFPRDGALAFGAGATVGTSADDGYTASASITFVLLLPGPVISLIGKANILSKRIRPSDPEPIFTAMATFDGGAGTFDMAIHAHYGIPIVLDIEATAELFVSKGQGWYFALGLPPHERRVRARIFDIFETDAYFVVSDTGLVTGTYTGYDKSWDFGPLSVSLKAYLATLAAIQWAPLEIGGGIELHGEVHLRAFGIGLGITADALLEGCAPDPFYIHGEISVELELPWPLPDVGATVSLTWGGDDGRIPPAPLALSHMDATVVDHAASSDRYLLLSHRAGAPSSFDPNLSYDDTATTPGLLAVSNEAAWQALVARPPLSQLLDPATVPAATVLPQDSHFTLAFAHPTVDGAGFAGAAPAGTLPSVITPGLPANNLLPADDMSNLNPNPPTVQWEYQHTLTEVAIYEYSGGAWEVVAARPQVKDQGLDLPGAWLPADPNTGVQPNSQLKVTPYQWLPGDTSSATWDQGTATLGLHFTDQGLQFDLDAALSPVQQSTGGLFTTGKGGRLTITFPTPVQILSITSLSVSGPNEFQTRVPLQAEGDGALLHADSTSGPSAGPFTETMPEHTKAITRLSFPISTAAWLHDITWKLPDIKMGILPDAPGFYALKTVTRIEARRVGDPNFQPVKDGNPVIEFAYFQTATGPALAVIDAALPAPRPLPNDESRANKRPVPPGAPPYPALATNAAPATTVFPLGGALGDLLTYTQWSWPGDGAPAAYYGYDVNVEFNETYVNALYARYGNGNPQRALHFRCTDRNHRYTLFQPNAIHVPSMYQQSALVAGEANVPLPPAINPPPPPGRSDTVSVFKGRGLAQLQAALQVTPGLEDAPALAAPAAVLALAGPVEERTIQLTQAARGALMELAAQAEIPIARAIGDDRVSLHSDIIGIILHELAERRAADEVRANWFLPLRPRTRYTLDVVAGPWDGGRGGRAVLSQGSGGSLLAIFNKDDAIDTLAALRAYYDAENALTALARVQFTTSRYRTFGAHLANAVQQTQTAATVPLRKTQTAVNPQAWLTGNAGGRATAQTAYQTARTALAGFVAGFDPMADDLPPHLPPPAPTPATVGESGLRAKRAATEQAWQTFNAATVAAFDGLVTALGHPDLASNQHVPAPPDTEISLFVDASNHVQALLLSSPEPFDWRRLWAWTSLTPADNTSARLTGATALWSGDGTRALILANGRPSGHYVLGLTFQGNIGAEAPCITTGGKAVSEPGRFAPVDYGKVRSRPIGRRAVRVGQVLLRRALNRRR